MSYTQAQLDALKAAYAKGELRVQRGDLSVTFQNAAEMERRIQTIERDLNPGSVKRQRLAYAVSGWRE